MSEQKKRAILVLSALSLAFAFAFGAPIWTVNLSNGVNLLPEKYMAERCLRLPLQKGKYAICSAIVPKLGALDGADQSSVRVARRFALYGFRDFGIVHGEIEEGRDLVFNAVRNICEDCWIGTRYDEFMLAMSGAGPSRFLQGVALTYYSPDFESKALEKHFPFKAPVYLGRLVSVRAFPIIDRSLVPLFTRYHQGKNGSEYRFVLLPPNQTCSGFSQIGVNMKTGTANIANVILYSDELYTKRQIDLIVSCVNPYFQGDLPIARLKVPLFYFMPTSGTKTIATKSVPVTKGR